MKIPDYNRDKTPDDYLLTEAEAQELIDYLWRPGYPEYHELVVKNA